MLDWSGFHSGMLLVRHTVRGQYIQDNGYSETIPNSAKASSFGR